MITVLTDEKQDHLLSSLCRRNLDDNGIMSIALPLVSGALLASNACKHVFSPQGSSVQATSCQRVDLGQHEREVIGSWGMVSLWTFGDLIGSKTSIRFGAFWILEWRWWGKIRDFLFHFLFHFLVRLGFWIRLVEARDFGCPGGLGGLRALWPGVVVVVYGGCGVLRGLGLGDVVLCVVVFCEAIILTEEEDLTLTSEPACALSLAQSWPSAFFCCEGR